MPNAALNSGALGLVRVISQPARRRSIGSYFAERDRWFRVIVTDGGMLYGWG